MWKLGSVVIREGKAWTNADGTVRHPWNWARWTDEKKKAEGLTWVADEVPVDPRFYSGRDADGNAIEKNISDVTNSDNTVTRGLKSEAVTATKQKANDKLSFTDWMVTRQAELGTAIPSATSTYRAAVRTACSNIETAIGNCDTHAKFVALYTVPDGGTVAPIYDWPDEI